MLPGMGDHETLAREYRSLLLSRIEDLAKSLEGMERKWDMFRNDQFGAVLKEQNDLRVEVSMLKVKIALIGIGVSAVVSAVMTVVFSSFKR